MGLPEEIAALRGGRGDPGALVGELRRTAVLVLTSGEDGIVTAPYGGVRWILAFTDEEALARYAYARRARVDVEWPYAAVLGARLLDAVVPAQDGPTGVAVNVADDDGSMLFPPVKGIVPDAVAVTEGDEQ
ncbi:SseB family protein [Streptomyces sp. NPDC048172]|uniref:SseB family protein n=1 Tax=Streptomyces sp. NPDC048172 TaxID=3365505 RepID=UPI0037130BF2